MGVKPLSVEIWLKISKNGFLIIFGTLLIDLEVFFPYRRESFMPKSNVWVHIFVFP